MAKDPSGSDTEDPSLTSLCGLDIVNPVTSERVSRLSLWTLLSERVSRRRVPDLDLISGVDRR
jgi:hypothetical protein